MIKTLKNTYYRAGGAFAATVGGLVATTSKVSAQCTADEITEGNIQDGANCAKPTGAEENLFGDGGIFNSVANALLFLVGAISVIMLIIGGIRYVVSAGDQNAVTGAKNTILYAIVGIVVSFLAYAAVNFVTSQLAAE